MECKNEIVITELKFQLNNFKGTNKNYDIEVFTQDETETDWYTVEVTQVDENYKPLKDTKTYFYVDSCGNMSDEFNLNEVEQYVYDILFVKREHGIIRRF